jgi:hypothetical protein
VEANNVHIALRRRMERQLGQPVSSAAWEVAQKRLFVAEALDPSYAGGQEDLLDFLRDLLRLTDRAPSRPRSRASGQPAAWTSDDLMARIKAVSRLVAEDAAGDEEILTFRQRVLGRDTPMSPDDAEAYLEVPEAREPRLKGSFDGGPVGVLKYQNRHISHDLHVWAGSPLDELRKLAGSLAQAYPWEPAQAAAFVLEGLIPLATPFVLHVPQTWGKGERRRARIIMEVDAWVPAATVLQAYREVQRQLLPGHNRPVSRRAVDLVNFVLQHLPATWPKLFDLWNSEHPTAGYSDYRHMRFAFARARQSLLVPRYRLYSGETGGSRSRDPDRKPPASKMAKGTQPRPPAGAS